MIFILNLSVILMNSCYFVLKKVRESQASELCLKCKKIIKSTIKDS